jgi:hypothetical protein
VLWSRQTDGSGGPGPVNTPAHLIFGLAAFGRANSPRVTAAALAGALAPDLSLYLMVGVSLYGLGIDAQTVFRELYYSPAWQAVFAIDNSFVIWGAGLALALWRKSAVWTAFAGAGLLHLAFDFPLHNHDARMHFWPLSDWVFESPVSYWDRNHHGDIAGRIELVAALVLVAMIWLRFRSWGVRALAVLLGLAQAMASGIWRFIF